MACPQAQQGRPSLPTTLRHPATHQTCHSPGLDAHTDPHTTAPPSPRGGAATPTGMRERERGLPSTELPEEPAPAGPGRASSYWSPFSAGRPQSSQDATSSKPNRECERV
eukprot:scaffold16043_cov115-Isochrysis_galbana.AAC.20